MIRVKSCRHGVMAYLDADHYVGRSFDLYGEFSEGEVDLFSAIVHPGDTVIDAGANIGAHTIPLAKMVGEKGNVIACEPQRIPYYCLCANVVLNQLQNVDCFQVALGDRQSTLPVPAIDYRGDSNYGGMELGSGLWESFPHRLIPLCRIDDLNIPSCRLLKIDVEGMESRVLMGASETIKNHHPIMYIEDDRVQHSAELRRLLRELGYIVYQHEPPLFNPSNFFGLGEDVFKDDQGRTIISRNLLCWHKEYESPIDPVQFGMEPISPLADLVIHPSR